VLRQSIIQHMTVNIAQHYVIHTPTEKWEDGRGEELGVANTSFTLATKCMDTNIKFV